MSTSKLFGAVCAGTLLLTAGCTTNSQIVQSSTAREAVTAAAHAPLAVLDQHAGQVVSVTFAFDRDTLDPEARALLDAQAAWMAERPELDFSVTGHADKVGDPAYNLDLGQRRAKRVLDYLVAAGIARERLEALVSHGEDRPLVETEDPELLNRRVTIELAGLVKEVASLDTAPWWQHQPRPHVPRHGDSNDGPFGRSSLDSAPQGTPTAASGGTGTVSSQEDGNGSETVASAPPASGPTSTQGSETPGSETPTTSQPAQTTGTTPTTPGASSPGSSSAPGKSGSAPGKSTPSKSSSTPSNDRMDAGRGNGEDGGDPGNSADHNQGGDDD